MNRLVHISFYRDSQEITNRGKYKAWIFDYSTERPLEERVNHEMRIIREKCKSSGFQIKGESFLICNEANARHFLNTFIPRIPSVDCVIVPNIHSIAANIQSVFELIESLQSKGIVVFCVVNGVIEKMSNTISILRAFSMLA